MNTITVPLYRAAHGRTLDADHVGEISHYARIRAG